ncbi:hypothetical protein PM082_020202 [Marasmius tenuissimus]|nr:hypothetical protein PM082_020202 [Marasmius tenuissimus]
MGVDKGVNPVNCLDSCLKAGFSMAGTEAGRECWCGGQADSSGKGGNTGLSPNGTRVPDTDCRGVCVSDHSSYCGNNNRIGVYSMTSREKPPTPDCSTGFSNFSLVAETSTGEQVPLKAVVVELVPSVTWTVLSGCSLCCNDYPLFNLGEALTPRSISNPNQGMFSVSSAAGGSPTFMAPTIAGPIRSDGSYCAAKGSVGQGKTVLTYQDKADGFALCKNNSALANGRLDVVFQPIADHPNYTLAECQAVLISIR